MKVHMKSMAAYHHGNAVCPDTSALTLRTECCRCCLCDVLLGSNDSSYIHVDCILGVRFSASFVSSQLTYSCLACQVHIQHSQRYHHQEAHQFHTTKACTSRSSLLAAEMLLLAQVDLGLLMCAIQLHASICAAHRASQAPDLIC